jgi:hypothetical protein
MQKLNVAIVREHSDRRIESSDPPHSLRAVRGGVLNDEGIGSISIDDLCPTHETSFAFSRPAYLAYPPIERREVAFEHDKGEAARVYVDRESERMFAASLHMA